MQWSHQNLLTISQLTSEEILHVFKLANRFLEINQRPVKKIPTLKGKSVVLFFAEPSTRTKISFDMAAKRLSADTYSLSTKGSSLEKGENLKDTALTLFSMYPDLIVIRHSFSGAASFLSKTIDCSIINAGWMACPSYSGLIGRFYPISKLVWVSRQDHSDSRRYCS